MENKPKKPRIPTYGYGLGVERCGPCEFRLVWAKRPRSRFRETGEVIETKPKEGKLWENDGKILNDWELDNTLAPISLGC